MWSVNFRPISKALKTFVPTNRKCVKLSHWIQSFPTASETAMRPHQFWDFNVPKATWDYKYRGDNLPPWNTETVQPNQRDVTNRTWTSIPDAYLPSPWSCNWPEWLYWTAPRALEDELSVRYALSERPLDHI
ncbi:hypothetical protein B0H16DRAFT_1885361 [Mycena metata]|uniref:Uncharacterized protein n=1 Tax=Mycena metata TaxID=1033252 RepID=A0AAD7JA66_9AGAR|nr:hypothetical protein B0H16DRAFT_1885361 [Mycena metata]